MAHSLSAKKRIRQNETSRLRNRARDSRMKTQLKKFQADLDSGNPEQIKKALSESFKAIDRTASKGIIHKNTAARKKSQLARRAAKVVSGG